MPRVVAIDLDSTTLDLLASVTGDLVLDTLEPSALAKLDRSSDIDAVVMGDTRDRLRLVRRCQVSLPRVPVLVIASKESCESLHAELRFSPFGARGVQCIPMEERARVRERILVELQHHRRRRSVEVAIGELNRRIAKPAASRTRSAAALLGRLLDIAPIGVAITDHDGQIRECNTRAAQLLANGAPPVGRAIWDMFAEAERAGIQQLIGRLDGVTQQPRASFRRALGDGYVQLELTGAVLTEDAGGPGYLLVLEDTTERQELLTKLQAASRAKDEFIAMLGHELRNPLAPIRTAVELLRMRVDPTIERECAMIERQVGHMVRLVDDLLDVVRVAQGKLELRTAPLEIASVIARAVEMTVPLLEERKHHVKVDVPRAGLAVIGDPDRLAQVFSNLLSNAAKYTDPGGTVTVHAARVDDEIVVRVTDTGRGIAPDLLPRVFDLFVQEHQSIERAAGGLGLGLSIVRSLVELHGGTIGVTSELSRGSEFVVRLPRTEVAVASRATATVPVTTSDSQHARVLVVDDNVDAATLLGDILQSMGYVTQLAHDGPSALQAARSFQPQVVLLDIGLPILDGYEVAQRLQERGGAGRPHIIALSGYGTLHDRERSSAAGFFEHLVKPVDIRALREVIERALERED